MTGNISAASLNSMLENNASFALIDVRESGEYNSSHIPGSSSVPRRQIEFVLSSLVPFKGAHVVVCDDDGRRAGLAAQTLENMGYQQVSVLEDGINRWSSQSFSTEWGSNVPSKDFGEGMEVVHHVPEIDASDLHNLIEKGEKLVILDTRTPEEYQRFCIPGGRNVPGGELALRITDIVAEAGQDTTVIVNCAGRTRSIIGTRALQRMGVPNIQGLKNGTSGWVLAGYDLETGADRLDLPRPSTKGIAEAEGYASRVASEDGVRSLSIRDLQELMDRSQRETVYLTDVRTNEEYQQGHIPGFRWFPGGQAVQRCDDVVAVRNSTIVFACDDRVRATLTASWYRQLGFAEVFALDGGTTAWAAAGLALDIGSPEQVPFGLKNAREKVNTLSPLELQQAESAGVIIFVDTSREFASGHVPGSNWVPRGWLELQVHSVAPDKTTPLIVTCIDGVNSILAGGTLVEIGYQNTSVLAGGMDNWQKSGLAVEKGLTEVMNPPTDLVLSGPDRNYADMMNYLRWEEALGEKYEARP